MRKTSDSTKVKTGKHEPAEHSVTQPVVCSRNINHKMLIQKRGWPVGSCKPRSERRLWTASPGSPNYPHSRRMCKRANALRIEPTVPLPHWMSKSVNSARNRRFAYSRGKPRCGLFQFRPLVAYQQAVATSAAGRVCWTKAASINDRDRAGLAALPHHRAYGFGHGGLSGHVAVHPTKRGATCLCPSARGCVPGSFQRPFRGGRPCGLLALHLHHVKRRTCTSEG